jgi:hypothetical protein
MNVPIEDPIRAAEPISLAIPAGSGSPIRAVRATRPGFRTKDVVRSGIDERQHYRAGRCLRSALTKAEELAVDFAIEAGRGPEGPRSQLDPCSFVF